MQVPPYGKQDARKHGKLTESLKAYISSIKHYNPFFHHEYIRILHDLFYVSAWEEGHVLEDSATNVKRELHL